MSTPKLAIAMNYIDDDLVSGAVEYKRTKKKNSWMKWGAIAACLCLVVLVAMPFMQNSFSICLCVGSCWLWSAGGYAEGTEY